MPNPRPKKSAPRNAAPHGSARLCVLYGPEAMLYRQHLDALRAAIASSHGETDLLRFDGPQATLADVLDEARSVGLMRQHKIIVVENADPFVTDHRAVLERYAQNPSQDATLVLHCQSWRSNTKLHDYVLSAGGLVIECKPPSPAEATAWLIARAQAAHDRRLDRAAAAALVARAGCDLSRLDQELAKVALLVGRDKPITPADVDQAVGRSSEEQAWVVQEAVLRALAAAGRTPRANDRPRAGDQPPAADAIAKVHELIGVAGQPDVLVAYFVADLARRLALARAMLDHGATDQQIASRFRLFRERRTLFMHALHAMDATAAARLFDRIVELDRRAKSGLGAPVTNLDRFIAEACAPAP